MRAGVGRDVPQTYEQLAWATEWYPREDTLGAAGACLVDFHQALPLTRSWGRRPARERSAAAASTVDTLVIFGIPETWQGR